jgi:hypothetical protein
LNYLKKEKLALKVSFEKTEPAVEANVVMKEEIAEEEDLTAEES